MVGEERSETSCIVERCAGRWWGLGWYPLIHCRGAGREWGTSMLIVMSIGMWKIGFSVGRIERFVISQQGPKNERTTGRTTTPFMRAMHIKHTTGVKKYLMTK